MANNSDIVQKNQLLEKQISDLQAIEKKLCESQDRYRALSQATFEAIFISEKGICIDANTAACDLFGYTHDELLGIFGTDVIAPESRESVKTKMLSGFENPYEAVGLRKDGTTFPCEIQGRMFDYRGKPVRVTALRDISFQVEIQQRLQQSQKLEALGTLAGGIAHDFNNLLTIILGQVELLKSHSLSPDIEPSILSIGKAGQRASALVSQLMTFSRQEPLKKDPLDLNQAIGNMGEILRRLISEDIDLEFDLCTQGPTILADESQLEQVVFNLVTNARDAILSATNSKNPKRIVILTQADSDGNAILEVTDTGAGMEKSQQNKIFDPFFTTKGPTEGTGLGLATVYGILKQNNARISFASNRNTGTVFSIFWPGTQERVIKHSPVIKEDIVSNTEKVLIVEDSKEVLEVITTGLRAAGFSVETATSASLAMELIEQKGMTFDVLITDEIMPGISGQELIAWMRPRSPKTTFILMSGHTFDRMANTATLPDDVTFLSKPFTNQELAALIRQRQRPEV